MNLYASATYRADLEAALSAAPCVERLKNTAILITGASGLIGSYLVDMLLTYNRLAGAEIRIYAMGRSEARLKERFDSAKTDHLTYVEHDVTEELSLDVSVDYIIHAASNAHPAAFGTDPVGTVLSNVIGTGHLLRYGREHGAKRFLFVSSGEVYGQWDGAVDSFSEDYCGYVDSLQPRSCYPVGKRAAETLCASYTQQYGLDTVLARPCHTYGPNVTASDNRATVQFMDRAIKGQDIVVSSTGKQLRSYCYVADCAAALLTILLCGRSTQAYNIATTGAMVTIGEFAAMVASQAGRSLIYAHPEKVTRAKRLPPVKQVLSAQKTEGLGWKGRYSVEEGIAHTLAVLNEAR